VRRLSGYGLSLFVGLALYAALFRFPREIHLLGQAAAGASRGCSLREIVRIPATGDRFTADNEKYLAALRVTASTSGVFDLVEGGPRSFWVRSAGRDMDGRHLIAYLLAQHAMLAANAPERHVQKGDVVVDVGGHVGVFTDLALQRGAEKVVAIEPEPGNFECLQRNFKREIEQGRVVLVQAGAWSKPGSITLRINNSNSGMPTMVLKSEESSEEVQVPVRPLDDIVQELALSRIDLIKMDIEGAEAEALKGAASILRRFRPRVVLDSNHHPDDGIKLPALIRSLNPAYSSQCGPCEFHEEENLIVPHTVFYF
jgi:FkbM family methyltransferase